MARALVVDEFHLTVVAPKGLEEAEYLAIRRTLDEARFQADLRRAIREVCRRYRAPGKVRVRLSR